MRGRISLVTVAAVMTTMLIAGVETAGACSCAFGITPQKQLKGADGAFNGRLLSVQPAEGTTEAAFRYRVGVVAKGPFRRGRVVTVWSQNSDSICGLVQATGEIYGLFVSRDEGRWASGLCSTTSPKAMRRLARDADSASSASVQSGVACPA
jgi:hypothetical protein